MVRLIHLKIPQAVSKCLQLSAKIESDLNRIPRGPQHDTHRQVLKGHMNHYLTLAGEIEGLKYLSVDAVGSLVRSNSFLKEFVQ